LRSPSGWLRVPVKKLASVISPVPPASGGSALRSPAARRSCWSAPPCGSMTGARASTQARGVAQAFTKTAQVPDAAVVTTVVVAGGAAHVGVARQAGVASVVEELLAKQDLRRVARCQWSLSDTSGELFSLPAASR
jgi:hypothetical protein